MKFDELVKEYGLLIDEEGRYYRINERGEKEEPFATISVIGKLLDLAPRTMEKRIEEFKILPRKIKSSTRHSVDGFNLNDVNRVCLDLTQDVLIADENWIASLDGRYFTTTGKLSSLLRLSVGSIMSRIKGQLTPRKIKKPREKPEAGYDIEKVKILCNDLLQDLPKANEQGIAFIDGQGYANLNTLTKLLRLSRNAITLRVKRSKLLPQNIKLTDGNIRQGFNIEQVKSICSDLLRVKTTADNTGVVLIDGEEYTSLEKLSRLFGVSTNTIAPRLEKQQIQARKIKVGGKIHNGFNINQARVACADLLETLPIADKNGIAIVQNREITPLENLTRILNISSPPILVRVKRHKVPKIKIRYFDGKLCDGYDIAVIKDICKDLLQELPIANNDNIVTISGKQFATLSTLAKMLKRCNQSILSRLQRANLAPIKIKNKLGIVCDAYEIAKAVEICRDYTEKLPCVNHDNIAIIDGQAFATRHRLAVMFKTTNQNVELFLKQHEVKSIRIRLLNGNTGDGYNIDQAKIAYDNFLATKTNPAKT